MAVAGEHTADGPSRRRVAAVEAATLGVLLFLAGALLLRDLRADALPHASNNAGLHFDPPSKCHNARNFVLFGRWMTDEWDPCLHGPLYTLLQTINFKLFGVGFVPMRRLSALISMGTLLAVYAIARRLAGRTAAAAAFVLVALDYRFLVNGRSALLEPFETFFVLLSAAILARAYAASETNARNPSGWQTTAWMLLACLAADAAVLCKLFALLYAIPMVLIVLLVPPRRGLGRLGIVLAVALPLLAYSLVFGHLHAAHFHREAANFFRKASTGPGRWYWWLHQPLAWDLRYGQPLTLGGLLAVPWALGRLRRGSAADAVLAGVLAAAVVAYTQTLGLLAYRPDRYYVPLIPTLAILAVAGTARALTWMRTPEEPALSPARRVGAWVLVTYALKFAALDALAACHALPGWLAHGPRLAVAGVASGLFFVVCARPRGRLGRGPCCHRALPRAAIAVALAVWFGHNATEYRRWMRRPPYTLYEFSRRLGEQFRDVTIAGISPAFAVMENRHRALKVTPYHLNWSAMRRGGVTHLLLPATGGRRRFFKKTFPNLWARATLLETVRLAGRNHHFYAVDLRPAKVCDCRLGALPESAGPSVVTFAVENPDPHTPQTLHLVGLLFQREALVGILSDSVFLGPQETASVELALLLPRSDRLRALALGPGTLGDLDETGGRLHAHAVTDPWAHGMEAYAFTRPRHARKGTPFAGEIHVPILATGQPLVIGAALRGTLAEGDELTLEWRRGGQMLQARRLEPGEICPSRYRLVTTAVSDPGVGPGELVIRFAGRSEPRADQVLWGTVPELLARAVWQDARDLSGAVFQEDAPTARPDRP